MGALRPSLKPGKKSNHNCCSRHLAAPGKKKKGWGEPLIVQIFLLKQNLIHFFPSLIFLYIVSCLPTHSSSFLSHHSDVRKIYFLSRAKYSSRLDNVASGKAAEALARHRTPIQFCKGLREKHGEDNVQSSLLL